MNIKSKTSWKPLKDHTPPYYIFQLPDSPTQEIIFDSEFDSVICTGAKNVIDTFIRVQFGKVKAEFKKRVTYFRFKMDSTKGYRLDYSYIDKGDETPKLQA